MNHPKVYDAKGRVLEVGSRVERVFPSGKTGGSVGEVDEISGHDTVAVVWNPRYLLRSFFETERRFTPWRSYRCPDLLLITDEENGDGPDAD